MTAFIHIPSKKSIYKVTEDCCYEVVSYDDTRLGVAGKIDQDVDMLNSYDLLCRCDTKLEMLESSEHEYNSIKESVSHRLKTYIH